MILLIQMAWSPFCISVRRILERNRIPHRIRNIPSHDRREVIRATHGRGYTVPCLVDGKTAVSDLTDFGQEVARYVDRKYTLGLFPRDREGIQLILARYIENQLEDVGFRINDSYLIPHLPLEERVMLTRFKERKFGKGCVDEWERDANILVARARALLTPTLQTLDGQPFLFGDRPTLADAALYGQCAMLRSGGFGIIASLAPRLTEWMSRLEALAKP